MPTPAKGARLGGSPAHERHILANLATALFEHGRITTTEAKARRLRPVAERLITKAKRGDLHARRQVLSTIGDKGIVHVLFTEIGPRYEQPQRRLHADREDRPAQGRQRADGRHRVGRAARGAGRCRGDKRYPSSRQEVGADQRWPHRLQRQPRKATSRRSQPASRPRRPPKGGRCRRAEGSAEERGCGAQAKTQSHLRKALRPRLSSSSPSYPTTIPAREAADDRERLTARPPYAARRYRPRWRRVLRLRLDVAYDGTDFARLGRPTRSAHRSGYARAGACAVS